MRITLLLLFLTSTAFADRWGAYVENRTVSPNGKHYVVARSPEFMKLSFQICRRRDGVAPLLPAENPDPIDRDSEDKLLAEGQLDWCPIAIRVLDSEPSAVLFEKHGGVGRGNSLALVDEKGQTRWTVQLDDLFTAQEIEKFMRTVSSIWWSQGWWIDEKRGKVVVVATGDALREVDLKDGKVSTPPAKVLLLRVEEGPVADRCLALEVMSRILPEGMTPWVTTVAQDEKQPVAVRLRAAIASKKAGEDPRAGDLFLAAIPKGQPIDERRYAIGHLGEILGEKAIPHLREAMRGTADGAWGSAQEGLAAFGEHAVPVLIEMMKEVKETPDYRGGAAHVLAKIGARSSVPALVETISDPVEYVANAAANAAIAIGAPDLEEKLAAILLKGSTQDSRLAGYFEDHPGERAVEALVAALGRTKPDTYDRRRVLQTLRKITGKDFGEEAEDWKAGLKGR
ncbi:MAG: HEAT repeat domain-containing protein [Planctomycetota bacterium]